MARCRRAAFVLAVALLALSSSRAADPFGSADPAWSLLHEPAVEKELKLSPAKTREFRSLLDEFDVRLFPLRNRPQEGAAKGVTEAFSDLTTRLRPMLSEAQRRRLAEIQARQLGVTALLRPGLSVAMEHHVQQKDKLEEVISETLKAKQELEQASRKGSRGSLWKNNMPHSSKKSFTMSPAS